MGWGLNPLPQVHVTRNAWLMALDQSHLGQVPVAMHPMEYIFTVQN